MIWSSRARNRSPAPVVARFLGRIAHPPPHLRRRNHDARFNEIAAGHFARKPPGNPQKSANPEYLPAPSQPTDSPHSELFTGDALLWQNSAAGWRPRISESFFDDLWASIRRRSKGRRRRVDRATPKFADHRTDRCRVTARLLVRSATRLAAIIAWLFDALALARGDGGHTRLLKMLARVELLILDVGGSPQCADQRREPFGDHGGPPPARLNYRHHPISGGARRCHPRSPRPQDPSAHKGESLRKAAAKRQNPLWRRRQLTPTRTPPNQVADIIGMPARLQLVQVATSFAECAAGPSLSCRWVHAHRRSADRRSCRPRIGPPGGSLLGRCPKNRSWLNPPGKPLRRQIER